jgi:hypothetical protein
VSNTGLRLEVADPHAAHRFDCEKVQFVGIGATARPAYTFTSVDQATLIVFLDEGFIAGLLYQLRDLIDRIVPGDILPMVGAWPAHLRFRQSPIVEYVLLEGRAFGTERAAIDRVIGIAFDVDYLRGDVLGLVAESVNDYAATDRAVWAGTPRLSRSGDSKPLCLRVGRREVETER